jgi:hypothetical protein
MPDDNAPVHTGKTSEGTALIIRAFKSLPNPLRVIVLSIVLIVLAVLGYYKYFPAEKSAPKDVKIPSPSITVTNQIQTAPQVIQNPSPPEPGAPRALQSAQLDMPYTGGTPARHAPGNANDVPQNIEAEHSSLEDALASNFHMENLSKDNPEEQTISETDADNYIHYKLFALDRCIWLNRRVAGVNHWQWIKDPQYHKHDVHRVTASEESPKGRHLMPTDTKSIHPLEVPASQKPRLVNIRANLALPIAVQGRCMNPHPGQFSYWWGPPFDQCNSPLYRRFPDGCTHYQIYNRCANSWDARIFWTYCVH